MCGRCSSDNEHTAGSVIASPPNILVILLNKFHYEINARQNNITHDIVLDTKSNHNQVSYYLIGSIQTMETLSHRDIILLKFILQT